MPQDHIASTVSTTREYYDGPADEIYRLVWGDNLHLGVPCNPDCPHPEAMEHTNEIMAGFAGLSPHARVLDLGCGYGSTARFLAQSRGCNVTGINISEKELELARQRASESRLGPLLKFETGDFHSLNYEDRSFDVVWSQEAFLHGADKGRILSEAHRVLVEDGLLVFTDIMVTSGASLSDRQRIYDRIRSPGMWDANEYRLALAEHGFDVRREEDWSSHVARSYGWVRDRLLRERGTLLPRTGAETIARTLDGLAFWVESANAGKIGWSLFVASKIPHAT